MTGLDNEIQGRLLELAEPEYRDFQCRLMPTVNPETVIGVRTPLLRKMAKRLSAEEPERVTEFIGSLPHRYYEENNLHAFLICLIRDFDDCVRELNRFLPFIDNWATCDSMKPRVTKKDMDRLVQCCEGWIASDKTYTIRFGIEMLMNHCLDDSFSPGYHELVAGINSDEYYVNMMSAWYFATALAKRWEDTIPYIEQDRLAPWVHQKTISKAIESYRITPAQKDRLRSLKQKKRT